MKPLFSVIVPVYNAGPYLGPCVRSLLGQTRPELEVILVDDGSTDGSAALCDRYAAEDSRVRVIHQANAGPGAARNRGLEAAAGDYLTFLDSDDFLDPETYAACAALLDRYDPDLVQWDVCFEAEEGCRDRIENRAQAGETLLVLGPEQALGTLFEWKGMDRRFNHLWTDAHCVWTKLCRRELFEGLRFPEGKQYEDEGIVHALLGRSRKSVFFNRRFSHYRLRADSLVHTMPLQGRMDKVDACLGRYEWMKALGQPALIRASVRESLALIFTVFLEAAQAKDPEKMAALREKVRRIRKEAAGFPGWRAGLAGWLLVRWPGAFVRVFGAYKTRRNRKSPGQRWFSRGKG